MNEIKIIVNFETHQCDFEKYDDIKSLISGDYNSTKLIFEFDKEDGRKIFEMKNPKGELVFADEIVNNEVILVGRDEQGNNCSLFTTAGTYPFEISLYGDDSKLTSESNCFSVQQEQVIIDGEVVEYYLPIFDRLLNDVQDSLESVNGAIDDVNNAISEVETLDIDVNKSGTTTTVELTKKDGTTKSVEILDGEKGEKGDNATINGVNTLNIVEGDNIEIVQNGSTLEISNTYEYDDTDIKEDISTNTSNISQNTDDIATLNNNLINYSLITETGSKLAITIDNSTYQMYITLKDKNDNVIHTSNTIDLPIEQLVMNVTYDNTNKAIVITLQNGNVTSVPVGALIDGLVSNDDLNTILTNYVQFTNYASSSKAGVIKSANYLNVSGSGIPYVSALQYETYLTRDNTIFISKGTLENVITGKGLTTKSYVDGLVGDIATALDTIQGEVI